MKPLPMPLRLAAGLVATAIEEVQELPRKLIELPVTAVSQVLQASMRMQQRVTELAIRGDQALGGLRPVPETPTWARFDEDEIDDPPYGGGNSPFGGGMDHPFGSMDRPYSGGNGVGGMHSDTSWNVPAPRTVSPIRIARDPEPSGLDESEEDADAPAKPAEAKPAATKPAARKPPTKPATKAPANKAPAKPPRPAEPTPAPGPKGHEDYPTWTLPQLRGRFRALELEDVRALLVWETSHLDRPPYVTMLSNRIASITGR